MFHPRNLPTADLYFARRFVLYLALCLGAVLTLVVVGDLFQRNDEFYEFARRTQCGILALLYTMLRYYAAFGPALVLRWTLPLVILLAGVIAATAACLHNEYTAMRASGVSMQRGLLPLLLPALLAGYAAGIARDLALPWLIRRSHEVASAVRPQGVRPIQLVLRDGERLQCVSMGHFDRDRIAHNLRVESREAATFYQGGMAFDSWSAPQATLLPRTDPREPGDDREWCWLPAPGAGKSRFTYVLHGEEPWGQSLPTAVTPAMLERQVLGEGVMTWSDLKRLGEEDLDVRLEMHSRRSEPWASAFLLMLGLAVTLRRTLRGHAPSYVFNIIVSVLVCGAFYLLRASFQSMGSTETLPPAAAIWLPVLAAGGVGAWLYRKLE